MEFIAKETVKDGMNSIFLNVNRHNYDSIVAYESLGFKKIRKEDNPIGHGYYMNDYVMEKNL